MVSYFILPMKFDATPLIRNVLQAPLLVSSDLRKSLPTASSAIAPRMSPVHAKHLISCCSWRAQIAADTLRRATARRTRTVPKRAFIGKASVVNTRVSAAKRRPRERLAAEAAEEVEKLALGARARWRYGRRAATMTRPEACRAKQDASGMAEGAGFEPAIRFPVYTLSRRAPSTARPPLRDARLGARCAHITPQRSRASRRGGRVGSRTRSKRQRDDPRRPSGRGQSARVCLKTRPLGSGAGRAACSDSWFASAA